MDFLTEKIKEFGGDPGTVYFQAVPDSNHVIVSLPTMEHGTYSVTTRSLQDGKVIVLQKYLLYLMQQKIKDQHAQQEET